MIIPYFLGCLGMGAGGTTIVYLTSRPFDAEPAACTATASGGCECESCSAS